MPRGDGSGPAGMGPMTGRGAGYCGGYAVPGYANPVQGFGRGFGGGFGGGRGGRGGGFGWRNRYWATGVPWSVAAPYAAPYYGAAAGAVAPPVAAASEAEYLQRQSEALQESLARIKERLEALEAKKEDT